MKTKTIVIAEDESDLLEILSETMSTLGAKVHAVANGDLAWKLVQQESVDLVISDIRMPVMDGLTLLGRVKELPVPPKFIMMTGGVEFEDWKNGRAPAGITEVVSKPFSTEELLKLVQALLS
jgi:CheY-like chemotaxis protein